MSHRARSDDACDITTRQERNRAIIAELARYSQALLPYREIAIAGLDAYETRWFFGEGRCPSTPPDPDCSKMGQYPVHFRPQFGQHVRILVFHLARMALSP